jgi:hypothetical protein
MSVSPSAPPMMLSAEEAASASGASRYTREENPLFSLLNPYDGGGAGGQQHGAAQNNGDQFFHRSGSPFIITLWLFSSRMGIACPILL